MDACVVLTGSFLTVALTELLNSNFVFICGTALTICTLLAIRRKTRKWKINYAAEKWLRQRSKPPVSPRRSRRLLQSLLWLPSLCAALVLCFSPLASHVLYSGRLIDFRVPIPWAWAVVYRYQNRGLFSSVDALIASNGLRPVRRHTFLAETCKLFRRFVRCLYLEPQLRRRTTNGLPAPLERDRHFDLRVHSWRIPLFVYCIP